ncbi:hypothetical protein F4810DRAFT_713620 [Camillea tinctor]|nr:hypothetical protein F4810DRAFT_713620 [Camillea tinctor]
MSSNSSNNNNDGMSILCGETWHWDSRDENQITFHKDGTGELICRAELNVWIAAEFDWKLLGLGSAGSAGVAKSRGCCGPSDSHDLLPSASQFQLEITLSKRRIPALGGARMDQYKINEALLRDAAFAPKKYAVALEAGEFVTQFDARSREGSHLLPGTPRFRFRLSFEPAPYPRREDWVDPQGAPDAMRFWEWNQFCGRQV